MDSVDAIVIAAATEAHAGLVRAGHRSPPADLLREAARQGPRGDDRGRDARSRPPACRSSSASSAGSTRATERPAGWSRAASWARSTPPARRPRPGAAARVVHPDVGRPVPGLLGARLRRHPLAPGCARSPRSTPTVACAASRCSPSTVTWTRAAAMLRMEDGTLVVLTCARHDPLGYDIRTELFGSTRQHQRGPRPAHPDALGRAGRAAARGGPAGRTSSTASRLPTARSWSPSSPWRGARSPPPAPPATASSRCASRRPRPVSMHEHRPVPLTEDPGRWRPRHSEGGGLDQPVDRCGRHPRPDHIAYDDGIRPSCEEEHRHMKVRKTVSLALGTGLLVGAAFAPGMVSAQESGSPSTSRS